MAAATEALVTMDQVISLVSTRNGKVAVIRVRVKTLAALAAMYAMTRHNGVVYTIRNSRRWFREAIDALHRFEEEESLPFVSNMSKLSNLLMPVTQATLNMSPVAVGSTSLLTWRMFAVLHTVSGVALSELVCARSITGRLALLASIAPGLFAASHYRSKLAQPDGCFLSFDEGLSDQERPIEMAKRFARLPLMFWLLSTVSGTVFLQGAKELSAGAVRRAARIPLWALSLLAALGVITTHKQLKKFAPVARQRITSEFALRDAGVVEASHGLDEVGGTFLDTAIPIAAAVGHLPHGAVTASCFVAFRAAVAVRGIMEASLSELLNARSGTSRLALVAAIVPGWAVAFSYRNAWAKSIESATDEDGDWTMQLAKKAQQLPPAYWLLTCISGALTIQAAKDILARLGMRGLAIAVGFVALAGRKEASQLVSAAQHELGSNAFALRQPDEQQTCSQFIDGISVKAIATLLPLSFAIRKVPLPAIASLSVLTIQTATAFNGVFEAAMTELLSSPSVPMRIALALAVTPGWLAALSYRNMAPMESRARGSTATADGNMQAEGMGVIEDVSHSLSRIARDARCLPPAFWLASSVSGAITLQAVSDLAAGYLKA